MESPKRELFRQRMMKRERSQKNLQRQRCVPEAINDVTYKISPMIINHQDEEATANFMTTAIERINVEIDVLERKTTQRLYPTLSPVRHEININSETRTLDDEIEVIGETPKMRRRNVRPTMESTRSSLTPLQSKSSQVESMISSIPNNGSANTNADSQIPYEVEQFLEDALGKDLDNSNVTFPNEIEEEEEGERTNTNLNISEVTTDKTMPFYRRISGFLHYKKKNDSKLKNETFSKGIVETSTLDRSRTICRTLSQRIKKTLRGASKKEKTPPSAPPELLTILPYDEKRMELMEEILKNMKIQHSIIQQACKALNVCHSNKEFIGSSEEVESERLLLLAQLRKRLLQDELKKLSNPAESDTPPPIVQSTESAEVLIEHVGLNLRNPCPHSELMEYFLIAVIEGDKVWGSTAISLSVDAPYCTRLDFPDFICRIENLRPNLKIIVEVYNLKLKPAMVYEHEEKYHIGRATKTTTCPSPSKFLKRMEKASPSRTLPPAIFPSSFVKCGELELGLYDLTLSSPWPLSEIPQGSPLYGTIELNLSCKLHLSINHHGFLNYGAEAGGFITWNRRWCVLKGHNLMFWNYPREQEVKEPVNSIDLINCVSEDIQEVSRQLCAKPRTICVETIKIRAQSDVDSILVRCRERHTYHRHLLSFDTKRDLIEWTKQLNHVIRALREWNVSFIRDRPKSNILSDL